MVLCRNDFGESNDQFCPPALHPTSTIECNRQRCPHWEFGGWSDCDSSCEKKRQVTCRNPTGSFVEDKDCNKDLKPPVTVKCKPVECKPHIRSYTNTKKYRWIVGKWKR